MRLLLDTHIAVWAVEDNPRLPKGARALLSDPEAEVAVSVVSLWEIAVKHALKNRADPIRMPAHEALRFFHGSGYAVIAVEPAHILAFGSLPFHHADPFDRLIVATALSEPYRLVTHDARLGAYSDTVIVA